MRCASPAVCNRLARRGKSDLLVDAARICALTAVAAQAASALLVWRIAACTLLSYVWGERIRAAPINMELILFLMTPRRRLRQEKEELVVYIS